MKSARAIVLLTVLLQLGCGGAGDAESADDGAGAQDTSCIPECQGRTCGDDGCGGVCGTCDADQACEEGQCVATCVPDCDGRECGDDGCGGSCWTGEGTECGSDADCVDGQCVCQPECEGMVCGPDGCGGTCGACGDFEVCVDGACECSPDCEGLECGDNGCGGSCGDCQNPCNGEVDNELCQEGACVPPDCCPDCEGKDCGPDGCGGVCGMCAPPDVCSEGLCTCTPFCGDKVCGDDGCGGSCGDCQENEVCVFGECCAPNCDGLMCGDDGCGGSCGDCQEGQICAEGVCCTPDCTGLECGDNGCGGSCGFCPEGLTCVEGICSIDPAWIGCSDGTREGFIAVGDYPLLAACGGAWTVPGIHNEVPACERQAGNTGENPAGTGCNVTDLCAEGWHVCLGKLDVLYRSPLGCLEIMDGAESPAFFLVRTSSTGAFNCAPDTIGEPTSINDLFGCGDLGCPAYEDTCAPLQLGSHDMCKSLKNKPTASCSCSFLGDLDPSNPSYVEGDFETVKCTPSSGGCGWCHPLDYWNTKLGVQHPNAWDCGSNSTQEANNVTKTHPEQQGGVLCCKDQCASNEDCPNGQICEMSTCILE